MDFTLCLLPEQLTFPTQRLPLIRTKGLATYTTSKLNVPPFLRAKAQHIEYPNSIEHYLTPLFRHDVVAAVFRLTCRLTLSVARICHIHRWASKEPRSQVRTDYSPKARACCRIQSMPRESVARSAEADQGLQYTRM